VNKNTYCLNQYYNTCCFVHKANNYLPLAFIEYAYFFRAFWMPSCDVGQAKYWQQAHFPCIQSMCTKITLGSKRASKWTSVRYSDVLQTLVIIEHTVVTFILIFHINQIFLKSWSHVSWRPA